MDTAKSEIHPDSGLEDEHVAVQWAAGDADHAAIEHPSQVRVQIPVHAGHEDI